MKLIIEINLDNAAFDEGPEAGRILRALAETVDDMTTGDTKTLRDINGNNVGNAKVSK